PHEEVEDLLGPVVAGEEAGQQPDHRPLEPLAQLDQVLAQREMDVVLGAFAGRRWFGGQRQRAHEGRSGALAGGAATGSPGACSRGTAPGAGSSLTTGAASSLGGSLPTAAKRAAARAAAGSSAGTDSASGFFFSSAGASCSSLTISCSSVERTSSPARRSSRRPLPSVRAIL